MKISEKSKNSLQNGKGPKRLFTGSTDIRISVSDTSSLKKRLVFKIEKEK